MQSRIIQKYVTAFVSLMIFFCITQQAESDSGERKKIVLEGKKARLDVDIMGGSLVDFHFLDMKLNPLTWNQPEKGDLEPREIGHLLCFDRWGAPSPQEIKNGMPYHGEAAKVEWQVLSPPMKSAGTIRAEMLCELPMGGLQLKRTLSLSENTSVVFVREEIININSLGRIYNIVQHPTISPPFLDTTVLVDSNAQKGFLQENPFPDIEEPVVYWPYIAYKGSLVDLRRLEDNPRPSLVSFTFDESEKYGWVTACNSAKGLLIGYIWELSDYPWLSFWRFARNGVPLARGFEFGSTGLHRPYSDLIEKGTIFNRRLYEYIDAKQTITKSYSLFLAKIPHDYKGVHTIEYVDNRIILKEHDSDSSRDISISTK